MASANPRPIAAPMRASPFHVQARCGVQQVVPLAKERSGVALHPPPPWVIGKNFPFAWFSVSGQCCGIPPSLGRYELFRYFRRLPH
jgi:hypothetical protein